MSQIHQIQVKVLFSSINLNLLVNLNFKKAIFVKQLNNAQIK